MESPMPQPIPMVLRDTAIYMGNSSDSPSNHRPQLALNAMSVIAEWAILEHWINYLFIQLLGSSAEIGSAIFTSLSGGNARRAALNAVAKISLSIEEYELYIVIMQIAAGVRDERNKIAHWVWGHAPKIPDGVLLIDPIKLVKYDVEAKIYATKNPHEPPLLYPVNDIFVYYEKDFVDVSKRINRCMHFVRDFQIAITPAHPASLNGEGLTRLRQQPEIQEVFARRAAKNIPKER